MRPSSSVRRRKHFQTTSPLKPRSRFLSYFTYSIYRQGERIIVFFFFVLFFCPNRIRTLVAIMGVGGGGRGRLGGMKIGIYCYFIVDILTKFYRNVLWVVLYKTYLFCCNLLIWLATKRQNLRKKYSKINSTEAVWGIKLKLCRIVSNNSLYKTIV